MNSQQLYDHIIKPTHLYMGGNYESKNANFLSLCTAAIESNCGYYIKQVDGPALGVWQMEPATHDDIWKNCDALKGGSSTLARGVIFAIAPMGKCGEEALTCAPMYACAMARLKYSMDVAPLPDSENIRAVYDYYKRIYNTPDGASTYEKFKQALITNGVFNVKL
ncbi:MAG TPA: hypothetical protein EYN54_11705 [Methylococcaceae bacterium]|nr:hypothetical protein [Methylococcaceae bacterium]